MGKKIILLVVVLVLLVTAVTAAGASRTEAAASRYAADRNPAQTRVDRFARQDSLGPARSSTALTTSTPSGSSRDRSASSQSDLPLTITRTLQMNAGAFTRDLTASEISMTNDLGLRWQANNTEEAGFYLTRPPDWDGQSPVTVRIYFALGGSEAGAVNWRLKLNTYTPDSGEWLTNPGTRDADAILNFPSGPSWYRIYSQQWTLAADQLEGEPLWSLYFVRGSAANSETFTGDLYVLMVDIAYQAELNNFPVYLPQLLR